MNCPVCDGKGIVAVQEPWQPIEWDGQERRGRLRTPAPRFSEYAAPFFRTCEACEGLGKLRPGLLCSLRK